MIREMNIIEYIGHSGEWYLKKTKQITCKSSEFKKGDVITIGNLRYVVVEDHGRLRVKRFRGKINPFKPLIDEIKKKKNKFFILYLCAPVWRFVLLFGNQ